MLMKNIIVKMAYARKETKNGQLHYSNRPILFVMLSRKGKHLAVAECSVEKN